MLPRLPVVLRIGRGRLAVRVVAIARGDLEERAQELPERAGLAATAGLQAPDRLQHRAPDRPLGQGAAGVGEREGVGDPQPCLAAPVGRVRRTLVAAGRSARPWSTGTDEGQEGVGAGETVPVVPVLPACGGSNTCSKTSPMALAMSAEDGCRRPLGNGDSGGNLGGGHPGHSAARWMTAEAATARRNGRRRSATCSFQVGSPPHGSRPIASSAAKYARQSRLPTPGWP